MNFMFGKTCWVEASPSSNQHIKSHEETCDSARLVSHPALLEFGMHDDDSAHMVVSAKRGWLGAKIRKLDERGLGKWEGCICLAALRSSNAFRRRVISTLVQRPVHYVERFRDWTLLYRYLFNSIDDIQIIKSVFYKKKKKKRGGRNGGKRRDWILAWRNMTAYLTLSLYPLQNLGFPSVS